MVFDKVKEFIADVANISEDEIKMESDINKDLGIDSLDAMEMILALEEEFKISIETEELENFHTVKDIVDYVEARL